MYLNAKKVQSIFLRKFYYKYRMRRMTVLLLSFIIILFILLLFDDSEVDEYGRSVGLLSIMVQPILFMEKFSSNFTSTIFCYNNEHYNSLDDILHLKTEIKDNSIFFHETSCDSFQAGKLVLTAREACAVESAALMNPDVKVYLLFASPIFNANTSSWTGPVKNLLSYPNVRIRHVNLDEYVIGTPLEDWYKSGVLQNSRWPRSHASDVLRFLTLWRFGGTYLDLDVVVMRSLKNLSNYAGAENPTDVAVGVVNLKHDGIGHHIADACLEDMKQNFRGDVWGNNGPGVITRVLNNICNVSEAEKMTPQRCRGFTVHPPYMFYPIRWRDWKLYFDESHSNNTMYMLKDSYAIHVWNKFSSKVNATVGSKQPYALIASKFCPKVYSDSRSVF